MVRTKTTKKSSRKSTVKKTAKKAAKKTATKTVKKSGKRILSNPKRPHCHVECDLDYHECVEYCKYKSGTVAKKVDPCELCKEGYFSENDEVCLSCGLKRGEQIQAYKGW